MALAGDTPLVLIDLHQRIGCLPPCLLRWMERLVRTLQGCHCTCEHLKPPLLSVFWMIHSTSLTGTRSKWWVASSSNCPSVGQLSGLAACAPQRPPCGRCDHAQAHPSRHCACPWASLTGTSCANPRVPDGLAAALSWRAAMCPSCSTCVHARGSLRASVVHRESPAAMRFSSTSLRSLKSIFEALPRR